MSLFEISKIKVPQDFPTCHFSRFQKSNVPQDIPKCIFFEISKIQRPEVQTSKWGILTVQIGHFDAKENRGRPKGGPKILVYIYKEREIV